MATYPFAAVVVAFAFSDSFERFRPRIEKSLLALLAVALLVSPQSFRSTEHKNPIRIALKGARKATWDARSAPAKEPPQGGNSQLLLATASELVAPGWIETEIEAEGLRVYRSAYISNF